MLVAPWPWRRPRVGLAFTERFLLARTDGERQETVRRDLPDGLVTPSVETPNIASVKDVATVALGMLDELSARRLEVSLVLPDLAVMTTFSPARGGDSRSFDSRLGFSPGEARRDSWRGRRGELLRAAVREAVVRQYEQVVEAAECRPGRIDSASLVRIPSWTDESESAPGLTLRVQLHRSHYVMAAFHSGELVDLRTRLRSAGDAARVAEEIERAAGRYGVESLTAALSGDGALACAEILKTGGMAGVEVVDENEESQLAAVVDALLRRSRR